MPYIPHTAAEREQMLAAIGVNKIEDLFSEIPQELRAQSWTHIPEGLNALEAQRRMQTLAAKDIYALNFLGAGSYEHHIPAAVWQMTGRGEFLTAYTPYQPEASQGSLQLIYEYQTMMAALMGLEVSNASMYDGASSLAEAVLMAVRLSRHSQPKILVPKTLHPYYRQTVQAIVHMQNIVLEPIDYDPATGTTDLKALKAYENENVAALIIPSPNFFGMIEDVDALTQWAKARDILVIAVVNPIAMSLLKAPGQWGEMGADIACGEGQPLGIPMASGGPYFGFLCTKKEYVRQMPGRIVGRTKDKNGKEGFVLTLQAREQHIRRAKATSNICTNQGLMVTAATIYMSLLGYEGLKAVALASYHNTQNLTKMLTCIPGVESKFHGHGFHERVIKLPIAAKEALAKLSDKGIEGGFALEDEYPELKNCILICATETKNEEDLQIYAEVLKTI